jgi:hypothetical protein
MRFIEDLCPPALLYLIFLAIQLGIDISMGMWATFVITAVLGIATVVVLDMLCGVGLSAASWFLVAAPFIITALGTSIAMGSGFDEYVLSELQVREKFYDKKAKQNDLPADSNAIST